MDQYDNQEIYCRKLGHHLYFSYCRKENMNVPCTRIISCWQQRMNVSEYLSIFYRDFQKDHRSAEPVPKLTSILEIVNQVKSLHSD